MKQGFNKKRFWMAVGIVTVIEGVLLCLFFQWKYIFPTDEVSAVYTRYKDVEGIAASYIKDYKVNDTVFVDVTLLEALDSTKWDTLRYEFSIPEPEPPIKLAVELNKDMAISRLVEKDDYGKQASPSSTDCEIMAYLYGTRTICIFHVKNPVERHAVLYHNFDKSIN